METKNKVVSILTIGSQEELNALNKEIEKFHQFKAPTHSTELAGFFYPKMIE